MMKHATLALVLAATLAFGLVGCGRKDTGSDDMSGNNRPNSSMDNGTDGEGMLQGRSFQEMLDNGRITDDDGNLLNDRPSTHR